MRSHSFASLTGDLARMGLCRKDPVMIHSSMKKIGPVEGGAETVLDVFQNFWADGLLVLPAFSYENLLLQPGRKIFDRENTPCCVGILAELFRKRDGVKRSLHPTHSLAAWGQKALSFTADHEKYNTAFHESGPFGKLLQWDAKILLAGVTLTSCTFLHALEEWAGVDLLSRKPLELYIRDENAMEFPRSVYWHKGAHSEMFDRALGILKAGGALQHVVLGSAESLLLDCRKSREILLPLLQENPDFFFNPACPPQEE